MGIPFPGFGKFYAMIIENAFDTSIVNCFLPSMPIILTIGLFMFHIDLIYSAHYFTSVIIWISQFYFIFKPWYSFFLLIYLVSDVFHGGFYLKYWNFISSISIWFFLSISHYWIPLLYSVLTLFHSVVCVSLKFVQVSVETSSVISLNILTILLNSLF